MDVEGKVTITLAIAGKKLPRPLDHIETNRSFGENLWCSRFCFSLVCPIVGRFRQMITLNLKRYYEAKIKADKSMVVAGIVCAMREACPSGGFLKPDPKRKDKKVFITVGGRETREKVGHCLRDMIASIREDTRRNDQLKILEAPKIQARPLPKPNHQLPTKMSDQQIQILRRLERGFDGSVEDLLKDTTA